MILKSNFLTFEINDEANRAAFILDEKPDAKSADSDFWRIILDDGLRTEIPVISAQQKGSVTEHDGALVIEYDKLISEYGDEYDVYFKITVECVDGLLRFTPYIENRQEARVNECFCPLADFTELFGDFASGLDEDYKNIQVLALFTGDTEKRIDGRSDEAMDEMIARYGSDLRADVIKYPHHGQSRNAAAKVIRDRLITEKAERMCILTAADAAAQAGTALANVSLPWIGIENGSLIYTVKNGRMTVEVIKDAAQFL